MSVLRIDNHKTQNRKKIMRNAQTYRIRDRASARQPERMPNQAQHECEQDLC